MKLDARILNLHTDVLSDKVLLDQTEYLAEHERGVTILALRHLREIEIRRLYVDLGYSSMYAYCIKHLKYSENKTQTRLAAARLLTELPEIEDQIEKGSLNITNLSKVQSFVRAEKAAQHVLTRDEKLVLLEQCENKPTRAVAKELIQKSHQPALLAEKFNLTSEVLNDDSLNFEYSNFNALLDSENRDLLQEFKNLYAHELPDGANITVLRFLLKRAIQDKKKKLGIETPKKKLEIEATNKSDRLSNTPNAALPMSTTVTRPTKPTADTIKQTDDKNKPARKPTPQRKPLPAAIRRFVWQRANACCEYFDLKIGVKCQSKFALQPDHIIPVAFGGTDEVDNLQLLCRVHNSRRAVKTFGVRRT